MLANSGMIEKLSDYIVSGKVNISALNSGSEMLLITDRTSFPYNVDETLMKGTASTVPFLSKIKFSDKTFEKCCLSRKLLGSCGALLRGCGICLYNTGNPMNIAVYAANHFRLFFA